ncbi:DUF305 domain-containing protein [Mycobacterium sp. NPDC050041]|uniref:DUF305 domain-containing protein n=1 Tax=Mycobacterium sp. NPDC050041 TaxID=3364293 RepID=UPI003C2B7F65
MTRTVVVRIVALLAAAVLGGAIVLAYRQPPPRPVLMTAVDIGFAQDMAAHHQQAVTMSDMLVGDAGPDVRALAEQIRFTQLTEIGQMTGWLQLVDAPPAATTPMEWMGHDEHRPGDAPTGMPGMASPAELTRLQRSTGRDNEVLFLQLLVRHHQGGIDMASSVVRQSATDAVRRAAGVMINEQAQDIQVMTTLLAQRDGAPLPYP